jgi:molybdopterin-synthase adenylyltransferase
LVYGSILGFDGRLSFIESPKAPCLRCIFPEVPPKEVCPVIGATPAVIGPLYALETIKYLPGTSSTLKGQPLFWECATTNFKKYKIRKGCDCPTCGNTRSRPRTGTIYGVQAGITSRCGARFFLIN